MNDQTKELTKDPIVFFDSYVEGMSKKGNVRHQLYLNKVAAVALAEHILKIAAEDKDLKIDMHMSKRVAKETGHEFIKPFAFVKAKSGDNYDPSKSAYGGNMTVDTIPEEDLKDKIERLKQKQV